MRAGLALLALAAAAACVSTARWQPVDTGRIYAAGDVDEAPVLLGCARYQEPVRRRATYRVRVSFVVDAGGQVEPGSAVVLPGGDHRRSGALDRAGVAAAESCAFEPARRRQTPVRVRLRRVFLFDRIAPALSWRRGARALAREG